MRYFYSEKLQDIEELTAWPNYPRGISLTGAMASTNILVSDSSCGFVLSVDKSVKNRKVFEALTQLVSRTALEFKACITLSVITRKTSPTGHGLVSLSISISSQRKKGQLLSKAHMADLEKTHQSAVQFRVLMEAALSRLGVPFKNPANIEVALASSRNLWRLDPGVKNELPATDLRKLKNILNYLTDDLVIRPFRSYWMAGDQSFFPFIYPMPLTSSLDGSVEKTAGSWVAESLFVNANFHVSTFFVIYNEAAKFKKGKKTDSEIGSTGTTFVGGLSYAVVSDVFIGLGSLLKDSLSSIDERKVVSEVEMKCKHSIEKGFPGSTWQNVDGVWPIVHQAYFPGCVDIQNFVDAGWFELHAQAVTPPENKPGS